MIAAYSAYTRLASSDIAGIVPGYLYLAHVPTSDTDLAVAKFTPSAQAPSQAVVAFQDGGNIGVFSRPAGGTWTMTAIGGEPFPCPGALPAAVQTLWGLTSSPYCPAG